MIKKIFSTLWKLVIASAVLLFIASHFSSVIHSFAMRYVTHPIRGFYAALFNTVSFPTFEIGAVILLISIPFFIWRYLYGIGSLKPLVVVLEFIILGYFVTVGIDGAIPYKAEEGSVADEGYSVALDNISDELSDISKDLPEEITVSDTIIRQLSADYAYRVLDRHITHIPKIKRTVFPVLLKKLGTKAYYAPVTAEVILDPDIPGVSSPYVSMHELMHFFGIMEEDGAIYHAIRAMFELGSAEIRYSALLEAFVRVGDKVYSNTPEKYLEIYSKLPPRVKKDVEEKLMRINKSELGDALNDKAIALRDKRGGASYGSSAELLASYFVRYRTADR